MSVRLSLKPPKNQKNPIPIFFFKNLLKISLKARGEAASLT